MVYKMYYSNVTSNFYRDLVSAQQAEALFNENVEKFDETRKQYLEELRLLREKYNIKFNTLLENIQEIIDSNEADLKETTPGITIGEWNIIK